MRKSYIIKTTRLDTAARLGKLSKALHIVPLAGNSGVDLPPDSWPGFFDRYVPGYAKSSGQFEEALSVVEAELASAKKRLAERGLGDLNPIMGREITERCRIQLPVYTLASSDLGQSARVAVRSPQGELGFLFTRLRINTNTEPLLVPYIAGLGGVALRGDSLQEKSILASIAGLVFFDTLRFMVANECLQGCPMRSIPWAVRGSECKYRFLEDRECCGLSDQLMRLYETGKKAGLSEDNWKKPIECLL